MDKSSYKNYIKKAEECRRAMHDAYAKGDWNAAVINAIHCAISSTDALTVFFKGVRHAGERHEDAVALLQQIEIEDLKTKTRQLSRLLSIKNAAEYEDRLMNKKEADSALKDADRFLKWAKETLGIKSG